MKLRIAGPLLLLLGLAGPAAAVPVTVDFEATGIALIDGFPQGPEFPAPDPPPVTTVEGQIAYDWDPVSGIQSLLSVNLKIGDFAYSLENVLYLSGLAGTDFLIHFGGDGDKDYQGPGAANVIVNGYSDFTLFYYSNSGCDSPLQFSNSFFRYTATGLNGVWGASQVQFTITGGPDRDSIACSGTDPDPDTDNQVPEPGTLVLLGLGLAGVAATRRRKQ